MQDLSDGEIEVCRVRTDLRLTAASELDNAASTAVSGEKGLRK